MTQAKIDWSEGLEEVAGVGRDCGKDPRTLSQETIRKLGHRPMSPLRALRLRCVDCCSGSMNEVRLCAAIACPSWPFRMGFNPWRERKELTRAQREAMAREAKKTDGEDAP